MDDSLPRASVIVPARNAEKVVEDCVRSLLELDYPRDRLELIVVDNDSRDGTAEVVRRISDSIRLLHEPRRGASAARNAGIRQARGDVVAFTDADCVVDPAWLRRLVVPLADPQVGIVGGTILARRPANAIALFVERIHDHRNTIESVRPPYVITMCWASRRTVLEELGGFDERFARGEDVELGYRALAAGYRLVHAPEAVIHHRNESTYPALFREAFVNCFHGVLLVRLHGEFMDRYRRSAPRAAGPERRSRRTRYDRVYRGGCKVGRALGRVRFARDRRFAP